MKSCTLLLVCALCHGSYQDRIDEALASGATIDLPTWETAVQNYWDTVLQFKEHTAVVAAFVAYESEKCQNLKRPWNIASMAGKGKVLFVRIDVSVPEFQMQHLVSKYDFKHPPFVFVVEKGQKKGIPFKEPPNEENLVALVDRLRKAEVRGKVPKIQPEAAVIIEEPAVLPISGKVEL